MGSYRRLCGTSHVGGRIAIVGCGATSGGAVAVIATALFTGQPRHTITAALVALFLLMFAILTGVAKTTTV